MKEQPRTRIFEIVIFNTKLKTVNPAKPCVQQILLTRKYFTYTNMPP